MRRIFLALGTVLWAAAALRGDGQGHATASLAEAERAFARMSVEVGKREAFLEFFADDGVVFAPGPVNAREFYRRSPPSPPSRPRVLDWEPAVIDVSLDGDLGYSTGPFAAVEVASGKRLSEGWFFSVWKRQPDGAWRVVVDLGVPVKDVGPLRPRTVQPATPDRVARGGGELLKSLETVRRLETALADSLARGDVSSYLPYLTSRTRLHRAGHAPAVGPLAIRRLLESAPAARCRPTGDGMTRAGDFAFVYGTYEAGSGASAEKVERGGYLRVWRRIERGWVLGAEVLSPQ